MNQISLKPADAEQALSDVVFSTLRNYGNVTIGMKATFIRHPTRIFDTTLGVALTEDMSPEEMKESVHTEYGVSFYTGQNDDSGAQNGGMGAPPNNSFGSGLSTSDASGSAPVPIDESALPRRRTFDIVMNADSHACAYAKAVVKRALDTVVSRSQEFFTKQLSPELAESIYLSGLSERSDGSSWVLKTKVDMEKLEVYKFTKRNQIRPSKYTEIPKKANLMALVQPEFVWFQFQSKKSSIPKQFGLRWTTKQIVYWVPDKTANFRMNMGISYDYVPDNGGDGNSDDDNSDDDCAGEVGGEEISGDFEAQNSQHTNNSLTANTTIQAENNSGVNSQQEVPLGSSKAEGASYKSDDGNIVVTEDHEDEDGDPSRFL